MGKETKLEEIPSSFGTDESMADEGITFKKNVEIIEAAYKESIAKVMDSQESLAKVYGVVQYSDLSI